MTFRKRILACSAISGTIAATLFIPAHAQTEPALDDEFEARQETVFVTARKREETIQDVPVSGTVLGAEQLESLVLFDTVDLVRNIPNAIIASGGPDYINTIIIRGAGEGRGAGTEPATGIYRNGIYVGSGGYGGAQFSRMDLFDIARSETFRGPQGGLFGRNAVGGAINVVTRRPGDQLRGNVQLRVNEWERSEIRGAVDLPVNDWLAFRVGGFYMDQSDGYVTNRTTGETADQRNDEGARVTAQITPGAATRWTTVLEYFDETAPSFTAYTSWDETAPYERTYNLPHFVDRSRQSVSSEFTHAFSGAELTLAGLYFEQDVERQDDFDAFLNRGGGNLDWTINESSEIERLGLEARLASTPDDGQWDWLIGIDHLSLDESVVNDRFTVRRTLTPFEEGFTATAVFGSIDYRPTGRLALGAELRISQDEKTIDQTNSSRSETKDFDNVTPVFSLVYALDDTANLYARVGSGYRSGGFNRNFPAAIPSAASYDEEKAWSYEAGWKKLFSNGTALDLGFYVMEIEGAQIVGRTPEEAQTFIQNAGDSRSYGLEFSLRGEHEVTQNGLILGYNIGGSLAGGDYTAGSVVPSGEVVPINIEGNDVGRLRDLVVNASFNFEQPVSNTWDLFGALHVSHESGGFENLFNEDQLLDQTILDTRFGIRSGRIQFAITGKNITDEVFLVEQFNTGQAFYNRPQVWGAEFRYLFGGR